MKITFSEVQAAQRVVASGIQQMNELTKKILGQAGASKLAMQAPAGQLTHDAFQDLGGGGKALAETLTQLHNDLNKLQQAASDGSQQASSAAAAGAPGNGSAVQAGMA